MPAGVQTARPDSSGTTPEIANHLFLLGAADYQIKDSRQPVMGERQTATAATNPVKASVSGCVILKSCLVRIGGAKRAYRPMTTCARLADQT
jgi:hypothetical protein